MKRKDLKAKEAIEAKAEELERLIENYEGAEPLDLVGIILDVLFAAPITAFETLGTLEIAKKEYMEIIDTKIEENRNNPARDKEEQIH